MITGKNTLRSLGVMLELVPGPIKSRLPEVPVLSKEERELMIFNTTMFGTQSDFGLHGSDI